MNPPHGRRHGEPSEIAGTAPCESPAPADSRLAVDGDLQCGTDLPHACIAQSADAFDEYGEGHAFNRVEIHGAEATDGIVPWLENDFTRQTSDRGRTWCDEGSSKPRYGGIAREHDDGPPPDVGRFAPPQLASQRCGHQVAAAAARNDARSPHSSGSSSGCVS